MHSQLTLDRFPMNVIIGVDFSVGSLDAVREVADLAERGLVREVHLVHAISPPANHGPANHGPANHGPAGHGPNDFRESDALEEARVEHLPEEMRAFAAPALDASLSGLHPEAVVVHEHVIFDEPAHAFEQLAGDLDADLIVLGAHRTRSGAPGILACHLVGIAPCPVLLARPRSTQPQRARRSSPSFVTLAPTRSAPPAAVARRAR